MGFLYQGGVQLANNFTVNAPIPLNSNSIVETRDDLNLPTHPNAPGVFAAHLRYPMVTVAVLDERMEYWLKDGLTDADWIAKGAMSSTLLPDWANDTQYTEKEIVWFGGNLWRAISTHTSNASDTFEDDSAHWVSTSADTFSIDATLVEHGNIPAGTKLDNINLSDYLNLQLNPELPPAIVSFTANPSFGLKERGVDITAIETRVDWKETKYPVEEASITQDGVDITDGSFTSDYVTGTGAAVPGLNEVVFEATVEDETGLKSVVSNSYRFVDPVFVGVMPATMTAATATENDVTVMPKRIMEYRTPISETFTLNNQKPAIWIPEGTITSAKDFNGFENVNGFESIALIVENNIGEQVTGRLYVMRNPATINNFPFLFTWN